MSKKHKVAPNSKKSQKSLAPSELDIFGTEFGTPAKSPRVYIQTLIKDEIERLQYNPDEHQGGVESFR